MDLNKMLDLNRAALMLQQQAANQEERRAYRQFASDFSVRIRMIRTENGVPSTICGFSK